MASTTPESRAKKKFRTLLRATCERRGIKLWLEGHAGSQYGDPSLDYTGALLPPGWARGIPFAVEVKRFDRDAELTARQVETAKAMRVAGIHVAEIKNDDELYAFLNWVESLE